MVDIYQTKYTGDHLLRVVNFALSQPFAEKVSRFSRFSKFNLFWNCLPVPSATTCCGGGDQERTGDLKFLLNIFVDKKQVPILLKKIL
jgi:hypothetical protein